ncbi:MAG: HD domain-containing protein [Bacteriovoracaceae bacterium]|jgi:response regulator RpfG family c-di-GMP phosphodiesterase|nr:HD domain-containing protein [Bacteriovoracaceae bacterium]
MAKVAPKVFFVNENEKSDALDQVVGLIEKSKLEITELPNFLNAVMEISVSEIPSIFILQTRNLLKDIFDSIIQIYIEGSLVKFVMITEEVFNGYNPFIELGLLEIHPIKNVAAPINGIIKNYSIANSKASNIVPVHIDFLDSFEISPIALYKKSKDSFESICSDGERFKMPAEGSFLYLKRSDLAAVPTEIKKVINVVNAPKLVPIRVKIILVGKALPFDTFSQADPKKVIVKKGTVITKGHIQAFGKHGVKRIYIHAEDEPAYQHYLDEYIDDILSSNSGEKNTAAEVINKFAASKVSDAYKKLDEKSFEGIKDASNYISKFLSDDSKSNIEHIFNNQNENGISEHAVNVANLSFAMYREILLVTEEPKLAPQFKVFQNQFPSDSSIIRDILVVSGLLHDAGLAQLGMDNTPYETLSDEQKLKYKEHVNLSVSLIGNLGEVSEKVVEVIRDHHEYCDGSGYPRGIKKNQLSIYSQITILSNFYDRALSKLEGNHQKALEVVSKSESKFNQHMVKILERLF